MLTWELPIYFYSHRHMFNIMTVLTTMYVLIISTVVWKHIAVSPPYTNIRSPVAGSISGLYMKISIKVRLEYLKIATTTCLSAYILTSTSCNYSINKRIITIHTVLVMHSNNLVRLWGIWTVGIQVLWHFI